MDLLSGLGGDLLSASTAPEGEAEDREATRRSAPTLAAQSPEMRCAVLSLRTTPDGRLTADLQEIGVRLLPVASSGDALELVREAEADVVLIDVDHAADALEPAGHLCGAPVAIRAARLGADDLSGALRAGVRGYLSPATPSEDVAACLRSALRGTAFLYGDWCRVLRELVAPDLPASREPYTGLLTPREKEILLLVAQGHSNKQIARALGVAHQTTKNQLHRIMVKVGVQSRVHLIRWAQDNRLVERRD